MKILFVLYTTRTIFSSVTTSASPPRTISSAISSAPIGDLYAFTSTWPSKDRSSSEMWKSSPHSPTSTIDDKIFLSRTRCLFMPIFVISWNETPNNNNNRCAQCKVVGLDSLIFSFCRPGEKLWTNVSCTKVESYFSPESLSWDASEIFCFKSRRRIKNSWGFPLPVGLLSSTDVCPLTSTAPFGDPFHWSSHRSQVDAFSW